MVDNIDLLIEFRQIHNDLWHEFIVDEKDLRICSKCGRVMREGYCIDGGESYFCDDDCLTQVYSKQEIEEMGIGDDDSESYYTEW